MLLQISLSAEEYAKGDRVAFKAKKDEWYAGTVTSVRAGLVGLLFDDGVKASPSKPSSRTWRRLKGVKKYTKPMTDAQVESAAAATVAKAKPVATPAKVKPAAAAPAKVKPVPAVKSAPATRQKSFIGSVVKSKFGDIVILSDKPGRKYMEYKWSTVSGKPMTGWLKLPIGASTDAAFTRYPFVRMATAEEMGAGHQTLRTMVEQKVQRKVDDFKSIQDQNIKPGDVVRVAYGDGIKNEAVLEVDYRAAKLAIVRQQSGAASIYTKRRMLPVKICTKVADGGGSFDPNNPIYSKHGIYIPQFYKEGNTVAKRSSRRLSY